MNRVFQPTGYRAATAQFWRDVNRLVVTGVLPDGRRLLMKAAWNEYPENDVFAAGAGRLPAGADAAPIAGFVSVDLFGLDAEEADTLLTSKLRDTLRGRARPRSAPRFPGMPSQ